MKKVMIYKEMGGQEATIREEFVKFLDNYSIILGSLDDELKSNSCLTIEYYQKLQQTYFDMKDQDNALEAYNKSIRELH